MYSIAGFTITENLAADGTTVLSRAQRDGQSFLIRTFAKEYPRPEETARLRYGYDLCSRLDAPGVARVLGLERHGRSLVLVMEDSGGEPLSALLSRGTLDLLDALGIAAGISRALGELHRRRIIHQSIEPAHILCNPSTGEVKLTHFDIASRLSRETPALTGVNHLKGTLAYLSPEQTGRMNRAIDYRTDFYSLGVVLYEMLAGRLPFESSDPMTLVHAHIAVKPDQPHALKATIPAAVSTIVLKLLAKRAEDRYQSAYGVTEDLEECAKRLRAGISLDDFTPGRHDVSATFRIPQSLYGREAEKEVLLHAFERVSRGTAEIVLVGGYSGVGKSALVNEIQRPVVERRGYYAVGKFDQYRHAPYSAIISAFRELIRQILGESEGAVAAWRERFQEALGSSGRVVTDVIPEVELIVGPQPPVPALDALEAQTRFTLVFQQFVGVVARREHPLAIFLDDLQWADSASLGLLGRLLCDRASGHLLFIGAFRDNELHEGHPLAQTIAELQRKGAALQEITLRPLGQAHVQQLITDTLGGSSEAELEELSALVFQKTKGNPFFVSQFLVSLHERELLTFDTEKGRWRWSIARISEEGITDNVASLMAERIRALPGPTQHAITLAACIGSTFDLEMLSVLSERAAQEIWADLWDALTEGVLVPVGEGYRYVPASRDSSPPSSSSMQDNAACYAFLHDRVREAAYALIEPDARKAVHLRVGRLLLASTPKEKIEGRIFAIVDHLDLAADQIGDRGERTALGRLNLIAAARAKASAAYASALQYLEAGIGLLPEDAWESEHELAFQLHREHAECNYLLGRFDAAASAFARTLSHARSTIEKADIQALEAALQISRGNYERGAELIAEALRLFGIDVPRDHLEAACGAEMGRLQQALAAALADRPVRGLIDLEEARSPEDRFLIQLLSKAARFSGDNPLRNSLMAMTLVRYSLQHGNAPGSSIGYVCYAFALNAMMGDGTSAYEFGKVALALSERLDDASTQATVCNFFGGFVNPWRKHMREGAPYLERAHLGGMESGALLYAGYAALHALDQSMLRGENLLRVYERASRLVELERRFNLMEIVLVLSDFRRCASLLAKGSAPEDAEDGLGAPHPIERASSTEASSLLLEIQVAYFRGDMAGALELGARIEPLIAAMAGNVHQLPFSLYYPLAATARWEAAAPEERARYREIIDTHAEKLRRWAATCPENFEHHHLLVLAEAARISGKDEEAEALYDRAIESATEHDFTHIQALANELAGRFYLARRRRKVARAYLEDARYAYVRWGAAPKVAALDIEFRDLLPHGAGAGEDEGIARLDVLAVMKASQAISGEIVLGDLLHTLMRTLLESAGAQRGFLILTGDPPLVVETAGEGAPVLVHQGRDEVIKDQLATAVVRYVERTGETVVLGNATRSSQFQTDPYIARARPLSILCTPIMRQKARVGLLYLENNLVADAFTPERCKVLELLSAQAAISLENARLYDTLDTRVKERTRELRESNDGLSLALKRLRDTQAQLISQEKLASLGALTAGIAHELKNPLNFITNFAALSRGLADEIEQLVRAPGSAIDPELDEVLGLLRQNVGKIHDHGRRADNIINGMLLHARGSSASLEQVDINSLVSESVNLAYHGLRGKEAGFEVQFEAEHAPEVGAVEAVASDLSRVFLNIIDNACASMRDKARKDGPGYVPRVRIRTSLQRDRVEVRIHDNGHGIQPGIVGKIFDPFFTTKPPGSGTGLGLSISYDIVKAHRGELRVETVAGEFAEFIVVLPRRQIAA
ncbi:AAA family ATPase [Sorangium sp. So ce375]|uniref:trifunctional serine/threonine-protein kinase/ATP-binding protein/sensor histidine kinase n=1 Tax=Sorangium sp. So ce375 TaxID=3133306 RepID=UPI003F5B9D77